MRTPLRVVILDIAEAIFVHCMFNAFFLHNQEHADDVIFMSYVIYPGLQVHLLCEYHWIASASFVKHKIFVPLKLCCLLKHFGPFHIYKHNSIGYHFLFHLAPVLTQHKKLHSVYAW